MRPAEAYGQTWSGVAGFAGSGFPSPERIREMPIVKCDLPLRPAADGHGR